MEASLIQLLEKTPVKETIESKPLLKEEGFIIKKYSPASPPVPFVEKDMKKIWQDEPWDVNLPSPGFITDLVYTTRGIETPTKFAVWSGLFAISTILKRDAYLDWGFKPLYPNLYVILVAPPRLCAKSTVIDICEDIFIKVPDILKKANARLAFKKKLNLHHSKITPEAINDLLATEQTSDEGLIIERGSEVSFIVSELTTFLGKQKYNIGLIDNLTKLYDSRDIDDEATRGKGKHVFKDIYVTLFGGTTPDSFKNNIPEEAFGSGFMSRIIVIKQDHPTRYFPMPQKVPGAPSTEELAQRLAWIAENSFGGYRFSKEAYSKYSHWYRSFKDSLPNNPNGDVLARLDTNLLKLSVLIRAQRYEKGNIITLKDFDDALNLLTDAYGEISDFMKEVSSSSWEVMQIKIKRILRDFQRGTQADLWKLFSKAGIPESILEIQLQQLLKTGDLTRFVSDQQGTIIYEYNEN
jgi:hypothetical protein